MAKLEKGPKIIVIGKASEKNKKEVHKKIEQDFFDHYQSMPQEQKELLEKFESLKSEKHKIIK